MLNKEAIKVMCRIRPENKIEIDGDYKKCLEIMNNTIKIKVC
jgi:hypothetical protein